MPVRLGMPQNVKGLVDVQKNPSFATGVGLLLYGLKQQQSSGGRKRSALINTRGLWSRMRSWFEELV